MKPLIKSLVILACCCMLFVSCKKDAATSCDGKGYFHYTNYNGAKVYITVDDVDYGTIENNKALEIPLRVGTFHYYIFQAYTYSSGPLIKEGDVTIEECKAVYAS
jgi:hypothetical protein